MKRKSRLNKISGRIFSSGFFNKKNIVHVFLFDACPLVPLVDSPVAALLSRVLQDRRIALDGRRCRAGGIVARFSAKCQLAPCT